MSANAKIVDPFRGTSALVRPRYSPGLLLRDDDLSAGVDYTRDLSRLLFRSLFGCGVVCGLVVTTTWDHCGNLVVTIDAGIALDGQGDPIHVPRPVPITIDLHCLTTPPTLLWVTLCHLEKGCAPRSTVCGCDDEEDSGTVCTRERDGYEIRIEPASPGGCTCHCIPPPPPPAGTSSSQPSSAPAAAAASATSPASVAPGQAGCQDCWCVDPCLDCYKDHYQGKCGCDCGDLCVLLARLDFVAPTVPGTPGEWKPDHSVRRFVRPVLMRDPQAWKEANPNVDPCAGPRQAQPSFVETSTVTAPALAAASVPAAAPAAATAQTKSSTKK